MNRYRYQYSFSQILLSKPESMASLEGFITMPSAGVGLRCKCLCWLSSLRSPNVFSCNCCNMDDKVFAKNLEVRPGTGLHLPHSWAPALGTHCTSSSTATGEINPQTVLGSAPDHVSASWLKILPSMWCYWWGFLCRFLQFSKYQPSKRRF